VDKKVLVMLLVLAKSFFSAMCMWVPAQISLPSCAECGEGNSNQAYTPPFPVIKDISKTVIGIDGRPYVVRTFTMKGMLSYSRYNEALEYFEKNLGAVFAETLQMSEHDREILFLSFTMSLECEHESHRKGCLKGCDWQADLSCSTKAICYSQISEEQQKMFIDVVLVYHHACDSIRLSRRHCFCSIL
jgi:hypothetical protein